MKIEIDKNNILTIFNESIPQTKEYTYHVSGYSFTDFDKWIIVLHKKEWKIINLKNLGDNMNVVYIKKSAYNDWCMPPTAKWEEIKQTGINKACKMFQWFDENTGKKYYFIPGMGEAQQQEKNSVLQKLWLQYSIEKTTKGMLFQGITDDALETNIMGYFFGLMLIYGKWEVKNTLNHQKNPWKELNAIKIQIPLSGQTLAHEEELDMIIHMLQHSGVFLKADKLSNKNGMVYQISSNDYELLERFAQWYEPVEKFEKISKREFTEEMKIKLLDFIRTNTEIPQDGKDTVVKQIEEGVIKLLMK